MRYQLGPGAKRDLAAIWAYIAQDNVTAADAFMERLRATFETLGRNPRAGRMRDDLRAGFRAFRHGEYLILYRIGKPGVRIMRIIHGRRDLPRLFH